MITDNDIYAIIKTRLLDLKHLPYVLITYFFIFHIVLIQ